MKTERKNFSETIVIVASFIAVWIYFGARIWAGRHEIQLSVWCQLLLLPALVFLAMIFVRRVKRVLGALRDDGHNSFTPRSPSVNGPTKR